MKIDIENLKRQKADYIDMTDVEKELIKLSSKLEEVINDRKEDKKQREEDKEVINKMMKEVNDIKEIINNTKIDNAEIKSYQTYTIEKVDDLKSEMNEIKKSLKEIINKTSFNLLDFNKNIVMKIFGRSVLIIVGIIIISLLVWATTGNFIFPTLVEKYFGG
ncbi:MAG: hypothetical protein PHD20_05430 [Clostridia bacterium]|nr:hypothetical protein [Clostridia bacterium]